MSNLNQRRNSPRRARSTGMHPGWFVFMSAHWGGFFLGLGMVAFVQWAALRISVGWPITLLALWMALFIVGGRRAEKLWERE